MNWFNKLTTRQPSRPNKTIPKERKYEGAARTKRLGRWFTGNRDANAELAPDLPTLRNRSRDLRRNNPYAARAISAVANNVVGKGIKTQVRGAGAEAVEAVWNSWVKSSSFDYEKRMNLAQMQHLICQSLVESGEVLIRRHNHSDRTFPVSYQVLESDFIDTTRSDVRLPNGNFILQGIEFNQKGERVAYYLYERHPGSIVADPKSSFTSSRIPASEIKHVFRQDRPGQVRGVPWLAPVVVRLKDLDDFEDAQLVRQKIAACFSVFVKDIAGDVDADADCDLGEKVEPGIIEFLPSGKEVQFANPPSVENYREYTGTLLRAIAAGIGVTYEVLTNDLSQTNFSSGRMGHLEFQRNIDTWQHNIIISQFLDLIVEDFKFFAPLIRVNAEQLIFVHVPPRREMIDPTKEIPALRDAIRAGLTTQSEAVMGMGKDPEEHFKQMSKDNKTIDELGLVLDSDPRKVAGNGKAQGDLENEETEGSTEQA